MGSGNGEKLLLLFQESPRALCHRENQFPKAWELWQAGLPLSPVPGPAYLVMRPRTSIWLCLDRSRVSCPIPKRLELRILELTLKDEDPAQRPREEQRSD